jgi:hypothetical protein
MEIAGRLYFQAFAPFPREESKIGAFAAFMAKVGDFSRLREHFG